MPKYKLFGTVHMHPSEITTETNPRVPVLHGTDFEANDDDDAERIARIVGRCVLDMRQSPLGDFFFTNTETYVKRKVQVTAQW